MFVNSSSNDFRTLPTSKDALFQHLLRASYQSGWVWGNSLLQEAPPQKESRVGGFTGEICDHSFGVPPPPDHIWGLHKAIDYPIWEIQLEISF